MLTARWWGSTVKTDLGLCCGTLVAVLLSLNPLSVNAQDARPAWASSIGSPQYFAVLVTDVDRSAKWYQTAFGLSEVGGSQADDGSWQIVNLRNSKLFVELIRDDRAREADRAKGFFKVGFQVPDVREVADAVERATGERPRVLEFPEIGVRTIQIRDPDRNTIQLASPLDGMERRDGSDPTNSVIEPVRNSRTSTEMPQGTREVDSGSRSEGATSW